jgi:hypothetical protein
MIWLQGLLLQTHVLSNYCEILLHMILLHALLCGVESLGARSDGWYDLEIG